VPWGEAALPRNQEGPPGPPGTLPSGTLTGARRVNGGLNPNLDPTTAVHQVTCPSGVAIAGTAWLTNMGPDGNDPPILAQIGFTNAFSPDAVTDWAYYRNQLTANSEVAWLITCATVSP
jgi:hypothetical protein